MKYINIDDKCIYENPPIELIEKLGLKFFNEVLENKFRSYKYPKLIIEDEEIVDIIEDIEKINEQKLNYTVVEDKPSDMEIQFAEYILFTEDRITNLENQIQGGM